MKNRAKGRRILGKAAVEMRQRKGPFAVYVTMRFLVIALLIVQIFNRDFEAVFLCLLTLLLFTVPHMIQTRFHVEFPTPLEVVFLCFVYASQVLGEILSFYIYVPYWDTLLHTVSGFMCAALGFSLVEIMNSKPDLKFELSPVFVALVAFCFSMTIGVVWEFFEFGMDRLFGTDMQKDTVVQMISTTLRALNPESTRTVINDIHSTAVNGQLLGIDGYLDIGLIDTMRDLLVNFVGAAVFSVFGYFYVTRNNKSFIEGLLITKKENVQQNEDN